MNDMTPKFCSSCGSRLGSYLSNSYDEYTGNRSLTEGCLNVKCLYSPLRRWYHDWFIVAAVGVIVFLSVIWVVKLFSVI